MFNAGLSPAARALRAALDVRRELELSQGSRRTLLIQGWHVDARVLAGWSGPQSQVRSRLRSALPSSPVPFIPEEPWKAAAVTRGSAEQLEL